MLVTSYNAGMARTDVLTLMDITFSHWDDNPWLNKAACRDKPTDLWFPEKGDMAREAYAICRRCPVKDECLDHAMRIPKLRGIWGGTTEKERSRMRGAKRRYAESL